jgi:hypothetical protein
VARWEGDLQDQKRMLEAQAQQALNLQQEASAKQSQLEVRAGCLRGNSLAFLPRQSPMHSPNSNVVYRRPPHVWPPLTFHNSYHSFNIAIRKLREPAAHLSRLLYYPPMAI